MVSSKIKWTVVGVMILFLLVLSYFLFRSVFYLFFASVAVSYLLGPMVDGFRDQGVPPVVAILISYALIVTLLLAFALLIFPLLYEEFSGILFSLPRYYDYLLSFWARYVKDTSVMDFLGAIGLEEKFVSYAEAWSGNMAQRSLALLAALPKFALYLILIPVIAYYLLRDKNEILGKLLLSFPPRFRVTVTTLGSQINEVLWGFLRGNVVIALLVAVLTVAGLMLLKLRYAAALGVLYALFDMIPYFGPVLGAIPVVVIALIQGDCNLLLVLFALFAVQQIENFFLSPKILGNQVGLHPVSVILLVLIGGYCGGIFGMVLVIPFAAVAKVVLVYLYRRIVAPDID